MRGQSATRHADAAVAATEEELEDVADVFVNDADDALDTDVLLRLLANIRSYSIIAVPRPAATCWCCRVG